MTMASDAPAPNMVSRLAPRLVALAVPITAVVAALALGAIMLIALGASPLSGYAALLDGAFGGALVPPLPRVDSRSASHFERLGRG